MKITKKVNRQQFSVKLLYLHHKFLLPLPQETHPYWCHTLKIKIKKLSKKNNGKIYLTTLTIQTLFIMPSTNSKFSFWHFLSLLVNFKRWKK